MLIVTNRIILEKNFKNGVGNHKAFGDELNLKGPNEVRLAHAKKVKGKWQVRLVKEPAKIKANNIPSKKEFDDMRDSLIKSRKNCVFFVHGFNQTFEKNLEKSLSLEEEHDVKVVAFSWPAKPGGFVTDEYKDAKMAARASVGALDLTLEKMGRYLKRPFNRSALKKCNTKFSLLAHSLGNYIFQNYATNSIYEGETRIFDNIVLCQPDVDNEGHCEWVNRIQASKRVYVTINENDFVLKWSDINFQKARLGRTAINLNSTNAAYFDFTDGPDVGRTHELFYVKTNDVVKKFFETVLNGRRGESVSGLTYDSRSNTYRF